MSADDETRRAVIQRWTSGPPDVPGVWRERRRIADALRVVIERLVTSDAPEPELAAAADALERYAERLKEHPRRTKMFGFPESANSGQVRLDGTHFDYSPLIGRANPLAPPMRLWVEDDVACGSAVFGSAYEGPPGCVHGGLIAAAFDEVLGFTQSMAGQPGMTGTLTVVYRKPTPLHTELRFEGRVVRIEGRKIFVAATLHADDVLCAECEAVFVRVDFAKLAALAEQRRLERKG
jgi:acyl-coenzyme A thioesterase PaaI-like protein